ncbi:MAG: hypothetical protein JOZ81_03065 [Chloroflexi bacterium]|nr:hypothetical protein [Chloroflexota bacterium]
MRFLVLAALLTLVSTACLGSTTTRVPARVPPSRLVLQTFVPRQQDAPRRSTLTAIDPDTLEDAPEVPALDVVPCSSGFRVQPTGQLLASVAGATGAGACADAPTAAVRLLDLTAWTWRDDIALPTGGSTLRPDALQGPALAWSPDGRWLYLITTDETEQRQLWLIDTSSRGATPLSVRLDFVPERLDVAPNGSSVFVLGGRSADNTRESMAVPGSGFVAIYDPLSLTERIRVPLSGLDIGQADQAPGSVWPGVAMAPDGSRYYVVHGDRPLVDVVDVRAPHFERLERSISLRETAPATGTSSAWLAASPDGARLYVWQPTAEPSDDLGLQMVDVGTWHVETVDPIATRLGSSAQGPWLFRLDPPLSQRPGAQRSRDPTGARLSVLDSKTLTEQAVLDQDHFAFNLSQYADRTYVIDRQPGRSTLLTEFANGSWASVTQRELTAPGWLITAQSVW